MTKSDGDPARFPITSIRVRVDPGYSRSYVLHFLLFCIYNYVSGAYHSHQRYVELTWTEGHSGFS